MHNGAVTHRMILITLFCRIYEYSWACVGERESAEVKKCTFALDKLMWTVAICCVAFGASLSVRFGVLVLAPLSLAAVGLTVAYGLLDQWGTVALGAMTITNLLALHTAYWLTVLVSIGSAEKQTLAPLHRHTRI